ncbi:AAA family ATPase [Brevibacterium litoralis]|uniref:AAA family ATPase n=1 Tax=Brevibacterium litoralis TaxID=3138935 RepID=UPI0032F03DB6
MTAVVLAVDVEFEARVAGALDPLSDLQVVRRPADEVELLAVTAAGIGDVVLLGRWFPGADAEVVARLRATGVAVVGFGVAGAWSTGWSLPRTVDPGAPAEDLARVLREAAAGDEPAPGPDAPHAVTRRDVDPPDPGPGPGRTEDAGAADAQGFDVPPAPPWEPDSGPPSMGQAGPETTVHGETVQGEAPGVERLGGEAGGRPGTRPAPVVAVWGTGSAPGRTTVAANLAQRIARHHGHVLLLDADTVAAAQAVHLGLLDESPRIAALCRAAAAGGLDAETVTAQIARIEDRFDVVTGLGRPERWPEVRAGVLTEVVEVLRTRCEVLVVDVADRIDPDDDLADPHYDRHGATRAVLDIADRVLLVAAADPPGLQKLVRLLATERVRAAGDRVTPVLTKVRASATGGDPAPTIRDTLTRFATLPAGVEPVLLPADTEACDRALLAGRTVVEHVPDSPLAAAIAALAEALPEVPARVTRTRRTDRRGGRRRARRPRRRDRTRARGTMGA